MLRPSIFGRNFVDDVFDDFFGAPFWGSTGSVNTATMSTDITENEGEYQVEMDLPGFAKEDVHAELKDGYLTISAQHGQNKEEKNDDGRVIRRERYQGLCQRSFYVGDAVTEEDIKAKFKDGVLTLLIPKKEKQPEVEQKKYIAIEG